MASSAPRTPAQDEEAREAREEFRQVVKSYIDLNDQLQEMAKQNKGLRKQKAELADVIVLYMKKNDIGECSLQDGKLILGQSKRLEPLKKQQIIDELTKAVGDSKAEDIMLGIFGNRAVSNKDTLKRTRKRSHETLKDDV